MKPPATLLRFSPTAWAKLLFLRDLGPTEIGGFGITATADPLFVDEFVLIPQSTTVTSVSFPAAAIADFYDQQVDQGRQPAQFSRVWIHTHPGPCPLPSAVDEATFARVFARCEAAVMVILAQTGAVYARRQTATGAERLNLALDVSRPFTATDPLAWQAEYDRCVVPMPGALDPPWDVLDEKGELNPHDPKPFLQD